MFTNDDYRPGLYGVAVYYVLGVIYFAIAGRHRLVLSPEEEFALTSGERGVPEVSYGHSAAEQEAVLRGGPSARGAAPDSPGTTIRLAQVRNAASGGPVQGPPLAFDGSCSRTFDNDPGPKGGRT